MFGLQPAEKQQQFIWFRQSAIMIVVVVVIVIIIIIIIGELGMFRSIKLLSYMDYV